MRIGFSAFVMQAGHSGVAAYIKDLFANLQRIDSRNHYTLMMPRGEDHLVPLSAPNFEKRVSPRYSAKPIANLVWHNMRLPGIVRSEKLDLVHIPSYRRIPMVKSGRIVATVHDLATFALDAKYDRARMFFNRRIVPAMIGRADRVITVSKYTKNDIVRLIGYPSDKIDVIYSGIDTSLYSEQARAPAMRRLQDLHGLDQPFFVYLSRLEHPAKNHVRLIEAFERFKSTEDSPHQLVLAGADWNGADTIRRRVARSKYKEHIHLLGFTPRESLPLLYSACDLMIYPSLFEGFGFPILEAMACGANVICSNTSSMPEIASDLAITFDPYSVDDIRAKIEAGLRRDWGEPERARAVAYASGFKWRDAAQRVIDIYEQVLGDES